MEGEDKYTASPQEQGEEKNLQERIRRAFDQMETDEGREFFAYQGVFAGKLLEPEYVELALRRAEKILSGDIGKITEETIEEIKENFAPFNLPEERQQQIAQNIKEYGEAYDRAGEDFELYKIERAEKDKAELEKAKSQGYDLDPDSALRAEKDGKYEFAYLIYRYSPWKDNNEKMKEIFDSFHFWSSDQARYRDGKLVVWARKNNPNLISVIKGRFDEEARRFDKLDPTSRIHSENMVPAYELLGDYREVARRSEGSPPAFMMVPKRIEAVPPELIQRFKELHELTRYTLAPIDKEELRKKVQAVS